MKMQKKTKRYAEGGDVNNIPLPPKRPASMGGAKKKKISYVPNSNIPVSEIWDEDQLEAMERNNKGLPPIKKAKGGMIAAKKVRKVLHEFKAGTLNTGSKKGPIVKSRKQAIAIALSQAGMSKKRGK